MTARFVAFEGGEAVGKSTQARLLADRVGAVLTREPGGTDLGRAIREVFLDPARTAVADRTEALLMAADRAQHVAEVVGPALASGRHVVTDRHLGSTLAYQGGGRGLDLDRLFEVSTWASGGLVPDLTVLLDAPADVAEARRAGQADRVESESPEFHQRVAETYRALAAAAPDAWVAVDATGDVHEVEARVRVAVGVRLPELA